MFYSKYKRKNPSYILEVFDILCVESLVRSRGVYLHTHLELSRSRFMSSEGTCGCSGSKKEVIRGLRAVTWLCSKFLHEVAIGC